MNMIKFTLKNIKGNTTRSMTIFLCVLGVATFFSATTLIVKGAENSLNTGIERLGADILVVPEGAESKVETALLMGKPTEVWMSTDYLDRVTAIPGVDSVSPQIYLQSLYGASCCAVEEMFLVVYDPATDFAITPWLERNLGRPLSKGEVIGGSYIFTPPGYRFIQLYGYDLTLRGNLESTGTGLDQTMFLTRETAEDMAKSSVTTAEQPLVLPPENISSIMVKVSPDADPHKVTLQILRDVVGVVPIESPNLFGAFREQMLGLLWGFLALSSLAWILSAVLIGLIFTLATNERRREMAVLGALGARPSYIFRSLLTEASLLAVVAGSLGLLLGAFGIYLFKDYLAGSLRMPFLFPSFTSLASIFVLGLGLSLFVVTVSALFPSLKVSRQEPAVAMRE